MQTISALRARWLALFPARKNAEAGSIFETLRVDYQSAGRHYHTLTHVAACLTWFDVACGLLAQPLAVELAIWFHDAVYDATRTDNERRSADLAVDALGRLGQPGALTEAVRRLVLVTAHPSQPRTPDEAALVDIDLSVLGAPPAEFDAFEAAIRREYHWVPPGVFRKKRGALLQSFLAQESIFRTTFFRERLEAAARRNLHRVLENYII